MPPKTVFINGVDTYVGRFVGEFLSKQAIGGTTADEDEDEEEEDAPPKECYTIVGTVLSPSKPDPDAEAAGKTVSDQPDWLHTLVDGSDTNAVNEAVFASDYVVWDIGSAASQVEGGYQAVNTLFERMGDYLDRKIFICLSSVMTWAKTRPADLDDPTAPISEEEFKRRRAHDKYRRHIDFEKHVTKCGKENKRRLQTYVVASGLNYGGGENVLHDMFKSAWHLNPDKLNQFGPGENVLPMIHISDLASTIVNVMEGRPESGYLLAMDGASSTLGEIAECIATKLGTGKVEPTNGELPPLDVLVTPSVDEILSLNLRLERGAINDLEGVKWVAPDGMIEAMDTVIAEYKDQRGLHPVKIFIHGPPLTNTERVAKTICTDYKLHYVSEKIVIEETLSDLKAKAQKLLSGEELDEDTAAAANEAKEALESLEASKAENNGAYDEETVTGWVRTKITSMACRNQGYVLDNYPVTEDQANAIFAPGDDSEADPDQPDPVTVPEFIFGLEAPDDVLLERAMTLSEDEAIKLELTEDKAKAAVAAFRKSNTEDNSILNFFDFREIHPKMIDVRSFTDSDVVKLISATVGKPHNYGPTEEELVELNEAKRIMIDKADKEAKAAKEIADAKESATRREKQADWDSKFSEIKKQESEALAASALPLRTFLIRSVMPTLAQGLSEVCKARPDDAVDALAEYLFKNNPQID